MEDLINTYREQFTAAIREGDESAARSVVARARRAGVEPVDIYLRVFTPGMVRIGELWERNELNVAQEHLATAITERLIGELSPAFGRSPQKARGTALIGCVEGERHVLGARMLSDLFRRMGWRVLYLGADVPTADWTDLAVRYDADVVAISAGMRMHLAALRGLVLQIRTAHPGALILVGGGAFAHAPELWRELGADIYHHDPTAAVLLATERVMGEALQSTEHEQ